MIYTANQPLFFPSIYMMNRYYHSKVLVIMDEAQFSQFGHQSRVEIMTKQGKLYLTLPLKDRAFKPINEVELDQPLRAITKIKKTLQSVYGSYDAYKAHKSSLWDALDRAYTQPSLAGFNGVLLDCVAQLLDLPTKIIHASDIVPIRPKHPSEWVAELGRAVGATTYLGGGTAQNAYIREEDFTSRGITLQPQNYKMPVYESHKGIFVGKEPTDGWVSILDPLLIHGKEFTLGLISQPPY